MTSTIDGTYTPQVGDLVWQQMYSPTGAGTIHDRVASGKAYGGRRLMTIVAILPDDDTGLTRWQLEHADPKDVHLGKYSWVEDDWCVLEPALRKDHCGTEALF